MSSLVVRFLICTNIKNGKKKKVKSLFVFIFPAVINLVDQQAHRNENPKQKRSPRGEQLALSSFDIRSGHPVLQHTLSKIKHSSLSPFR